MCLQYFWAVYIVILISGMATRIFIFSITNYMFLIWQNKRKRVLDLQLCLWDKHNCTWTKMNVNHCELIRLWEYHMLEQVVSLTELHSLVSIKNASIFTVESCAKWEPLFCFVLVSAYRHSSLLNQMLFLSDVNIVLCGLNSFHSILNVLYELSHCYFTYNWAIMVQICKSNYKWLINGRYCF